MITMYEEFGLEKLTIENFEKWFDLDVFEEKISKLDFTKIFMKKKEVETIIKNFFFFDLKKIEKKIKEMNFFDPKDFLEVRVMEPSKINEIYIINKKIEFYKKNKIETLNEDLLSVLGLEMLRCKQKKLEICDFKKIKENLFFIRIYESDMKTYKRTYTKDYHDLIVMLREKKSLEKRKEITEKINEFFFEILKEEGDKFENYLLMHVLTKIFNTLLDEKELAAKIIYKNQRDYKYNQNIIINSNPESCHLSEEYFKDLKEINFESFFLDILKTEGKLKKKYEEEIIKILSST